MVVGRTLLPSGAQNKPSPLCVRGVFFLAPLCVTSSELLTFFDSAGGGTTVPLATIPTIGLHRPPPRRLGHPGGQPPVYPPSPRFRPVNTGSMLGGGEGAPSITPPRFVTPQGSCQKVRVRTKMSWLSGVHVRLNVSCENFPGGGRYFAQQALGRRFDPPSVWE